MNIKRDVYYRAIQSSKIDLFKKLAFSNSFEIVSDVWANSLDWPGPAIDLGDTDADAHVSD